MRDTLRRPGARAAALACAAVVLAAWPVAPARARNHRGGAPTISAKAAILVEASSGEVVYARAADRIRPIASATKLMTALLALERSSLTASLVAPPYQPAAPETRIGLRAGERMRVSDLLRALLLASANDAAVALAEGIADSRRSFVIAMNRRARALGLARTSFQNPIGLDSRGNFSTARDLARLTIVLRRHPFFARTVALGQATLRSGRRRRTIVNRNPLVRSTPWVNGVKTGYTRGAGYVLVGSGTRAGVSLVSVVLGAPSESARAADTLALLRYGHRRYRSTLAVRRGATFARAHVRDFPGRSIALVATRDARVTIRRGAALRLLPVTRSELRGPLRSGAPVGYVDVLLGARRLARVPLATVGQVPEAGALRRIGNVLGTPLAAPVLATMVIMSVLWARRRRRRSFSDSDARREKVGPA